MLLPLYPSVDASPSGAAPALVNSVDYASNKSVFAFLAFLPRAQGAIEVSAAALTLTNAPYSVGAAEATQQRTVLRTATVYSSVGVSGRDTVLAAVQLSDAEGNTAFERSGLELRLVLRSSMGEVSNVCPPVGASSGLTTCSCTAPAGWFSSSETGSANATVQLNYGGTSASAVEAEGGARAAEADGKGAHTVQDRRDRVARGRGEGAESVGRQRSCAILPARGVFRHLGGNRGGTRELARRDRLL